MDSGLESLARFDHPAEPTLLFEHQGDSAHSLESHHLVEYADAAGADVQQVVRDLDRGTWVERVREDFMSGVRSGVNGTPTFFIDGVRFDGDWSDGEAFIQRLRGGARDGVPRARRDRRVS